jgi:hypothetical protein
MYASRALLMVVDDRMVNPVVWIQFNSHYAVGCGSGSGVTGSSIGSATVRTQLIVRVRVWYHCSSGLKRSIGSLQFLQVDSSIATPYLSTGIGINMT